MEADFNSTDRKKSPIDRLIFVFVAIALVLRLYILYYPFALYSYLVPPGQDPANHYGIIKNLMSFNFSSTYPWLFHLIIALVSKLTASDPMTVLRIVTPALVVLPSIAIYILLKRVFGQVSALIGFTFCLWGSNYALVAFGDGNYPNIIAGGFLLPLTLLFLVLSFQKRKLSYYVTTLTLSFLTLFTHHLSAAYLAIIIIVYLIALGIWNKFEKIAPNYRRMAIFIIILLVAAGAIVSLISLKTIFVGALNSFAQNGSFMASAGFATPIDFAEYAPQIGPLVFYGGLLGLVVLVYLLGQSKEKVNKPFLLLILVWFVVGYAMSRISQVGLPGRFAREVAIPLILALAVSLAYLLNMMRSNLQKIFAVSILGFILVTNLVQINGGAYRAPDFFNKMIWFSQGDKQAADSIKLSTPETAVIYSNPTSPYLPIFTQRTIRFVGLDESVELLSSIWSIKQAENNFVFIGKKTASNPDGDSYSFFANFDKITSNLQTAMEGAKCQEVGGFDPNSKLYDLSTCKAKIKEPVVKK